LGQRITTRDRFFDWRTGLVADRDRRSTKRDEDRVALIGQLLSLGKGLPQTPSSRDKNKQIEKSLFFNGFSF
jgi:hypothetical protein